MCSFPDIFLPNGIVFHVFCFIEYKSLFIKISGMLVFLPEINFGIPAKNALPIDLCFNIEPPLNGMHFFCTSG